MAGDVWGGLRGVPESEEVGAAGVPGLQLHLHIVAIPLLKGASREMRAGLSPSPHNKKSIRPDSLEGCPLPIQSKGQTCQGQIRLGQIRLAKIMGLGALKVRFVQRVLQKVVPPFLVYQG
jgi:hypothetical protein